MELKISLSAMITYIGNLSLSHGCPDRWVWLMDRNGVFSVKTFSIIIKRRLVDFPIKKSEFIWNKWVPNKVNICGWRAFINRLPTLPNFNHRGVQVNSLRYLFCDRDDESMQHCFIDCSVIKPIWLKVCGW